MLDTRMTRVGGPRARSRAETRLARIVAGALLAAAFGGAQQRVEVEAPGTPPAHRVVDLEPGQQSFPIPMAPPTPIGDVHVAWIEESQFSDLSFLWRLDTRNRRASLLAEICPLSYPFLGAQLFFPMGDRLYFSAFPRPLTTAEPVALSLWSSDGTPGGTAPVATPSGGAYHYPAALTLFNGSLYFFASTLESSEYRLWRTAGTADASVALAGARGFPPTFIGFEGSVSVGLSEPPMTVVGEKLIFVGESDRDPSKPYALYRTDRSDAIAFLRDFPEVPSPLVEMGGMGYFPVISLYSGGRQELWRTDGTPEGTEIVRDFCSPSCGSSLGSMKVVNNRLYFAITAPAGVRQVWTSDGTRTGTVLLAQLGKSPFTPPLAFTAALGQIFFVADDGVHGAELWRSDGTPAGTRLVRDIRPGGDSSGVTNLVPFGSWLLFTADDGVHGVELWRTDGTESGTTLVADIAPGPGSSAPQTLVASNGEVYFSADDGVHGRELWQTDATGVGTQLISDFRPGSAGSTPYVVASSTGTPFFLARDTEALRVWEIAGSTSRIEPIGTIDAGTLPFSSNPYGFTDVQGTLCFITGRGGSGTVPQLWASDGTEQGTRLLRTMYAGAPVSLGKSLYFTGTTDLAGSFTYKFYRFDLSRNLLQPLLDAYSVFPTVVGQTLFFLVNNSELWKIEAGSDSPVLVKRFNGSLSYMVESGGVLYLPVQSDTQPGLWRSDGSESGTVLVRSGFARLLAGTPKGIFFATSDYFTGQATLWFLGNKEASATPIGRFPLDLIYGDPFVDSVGAGSHLYSFVRDIPTGRLQLWRSDGSGTGAMRLSDVSVRTGSLRSDGSRVYFVASDEEHGRELWASDGTAQGTRLVKDVNPGPGGSNPMDLAVVDGILLFTADDSLHGRELWRSDGTPEGTYLLQDICPGPCSSDPSGFTKSGSSVYFAANDHVTGNELWSMPAASIPSAPGRRPQAPVSPRR